MKYSELKRRVQILKENGYEKFPRLPFYEKRYNLGNLWYKNTISNLDVKNLRVLTPIIIQLDQRAWGKLYEVQG